MERPFNGKRQGAEPKNVTLLPTEPLSTEISHNGHKPSSEVIPKTPVSPFSQTDFPETKDIIDDSCTKCFGGLKDCEIDSCPFTLEEIGDQDLD